MSDTPRVPITAARRDLAELCDRVHRDGERVVIQRSGRESAALVSIDDLRLLEVLEAELEERWAQDALERASRERTPSISLDDYRRARGL